MIKPAFYGLLYVGDAIHRHSNTKERGELVQETYLKNAINCCLSFNAMGYEFSLITNKVDLVRERVAKFGKHSMKILQGDFALDVPSDIKFFEAHFKLDVFRMFARGELGAFVGLVDIDAILLKAFPEFDDNFLYVYDISTASFEACTPEVVAGDFGRLGAADISPKWYGGEFIVGSASMFLELTKVLDDVWPHYTSAYRNLHHQGDEMLVSVAIEKLRRKGVQIFDAGSAPLVQRWWSARTLHRQPFLSNVEHTCLLHLPSDKEFLGRTMVAPFNADAVLADYKAHIKNKLRMRRALSNIESLLSRNRKYSQHI